MNSHSGVGSVVPESLHAVSNSLNYIEESRNTLHQARRKLNQLDEECKEVKEKLLDEVSQQPAVQNALVSVECELAGVYMKMMVSDNICKKLELELAASTENLVKSKMELQQLNNDMLLSSMEFSQNWNCASSGIELRKSKRNQKIQDVTNLRRQLNQGLENFYENNRTYEVALDDKRKFEIEADMHMKDLTHKEAYTYERIQAVENDIITLQNREENSVSCGSDTSRLETQIESTKISIAMIKSTLERQRGFNQNRTSNADDQDSHIIPIVQKSTALKRSNGTKPGQCQFTKHKNGQQQQEPPAKFRALGSIARQHAYSTTSKFSERKQNSLEQKSNVQNSTRECREGQHQFLKHKNQQQIQEPPFERAVNSVVHPSAKPMDSFPTPIQKPSNPAKILNVPNSNSGGTTHCSRSSQKFAFRRKLATAVPLSSISSNSNQATVPLKSCLKTTSASENLKISSSGLNMDEACRLNSINDTSGLNSLSRNVSAFGRVARGSGFIGAKNISHSHSSFANRGRNTSM